MDNWIVYRHTSPSGKCYIGITSKTPQERWGINGKRYYAKTNGKYRHPLFVRALIKYGWNNFKHELLFVGLSEQRAKSLEVDLIRHYKGLNLSYNITDGGDGVIGVPYDNKRKKVISAKMKEWHRTHEAATLGMHHTEEAKRNISKHHRHRQSEETRHKISSIQLGKKFPKWRRELLSAAHNKEKIPIIQLSMNNEFIAEYTSIMDASRATGIYNALISGAIKRKGSAKGFKWLNKKDYDSKNIRNN